MSLEVRRAIVAALQELPEMSRREHAKIFTVDKPVWEVLYGGRIRDSNRYKSVFTVVVWGGLNIVSTSHVILQLAVEQVTDALWPVPCITIGDVSVDVQIPGLSELEFTHAELTVTEA